MKKLTKLLARFILFSAAACAILFGLPALATRHPFILLTVSLYSLMERSSAMKLQYHKIRGVDKSVCTAEQKIAYNMASRIYGDIRFAKAWQQYDSGKVPAFLQNDWESKAIRTYFTTWQRDYNKASAHYNEDAIFSALRAGLHDFICHHAPIFTTYREVGQAFPAHYL